jgi:hypothetical protein
MRKEPMTIIKRQGLWIAPYASHTTEHDRDKMTTVKLIDCEVLHADLSQLLITKETFLRDAPGRLCYHYREKFV